MNDYLTFNLIIVFISIICLSLNYLFKKLDIPGFSALSEIAGYILAVVFLVKFAENNIMKISSIFNFLY